MGLALWLRIANLFKVLLMHPTDSHSKPAEVEDQLTVAVHTHDVALIAGKGTGEHAQKDAVASETLEWLTQKGDLFGMSLYHAHKRLHHRIGNGGRTTRATVLYKMVLGEIIVQKPLQVRHLSLQKDQSADRRAQHSARTCLCLFVFVLVLVRLVDEITLGEGRLTIVAVEPLAESAGSHVVQIEIAPGRSQITRGYNLYFRARQRASLLNVDALWQAYACVGCRKRIRAIQRHRLFLLYVLACGHNRRRQASCRHNQLVHHNETLLMSFPPRE